MSDLVIIERSDITAVADSIRNKTGATGDLTIGEMIDCIDSFSSGGSGEKINAPEMRTITLNFVRNPWAEFSQEVGVMVDFLGIDETGTLRNMRETVFTGNSATIQCLADGIIILGSEMIIIDSPFDTGEEYYPPLATNGYFFAGYGGVLDNIIVLVADYDMDIEVTVG